MTSSRIFRVTGPPGTGILAANAVESVAQRATPRDCNRRGHGNEEVTSMQGKSSPFPYRRIKGKLVHRIVAEQMLGRALLPREVVHHIDGDPLNNDPSNLQVLPSQAEHARLHSTKDRKCEAEGCDRKHFVHGMCKMHAQRAAARGRGVPERQVGRPICTVEGCEQPNNARGLCINHYSAWRRKGVMP